MNRYNRHGIEVNTNTVLNADDCFSDVVHVYLHVIAIYVHLLAIVEFI